MKEKRILAMFVTSAVTLVASLAVTFGVLMTLADPVVATGVTRYEFSFGLANNSLISSNDNKLSLKDDVIFQPSSAAVWSDVAGEEIIWFNGSTYEDEIVYADESISAKVKVIPFRVSNNYQQDINVRINVAYNASTLLKTFTGIKVYNYSDNTFKSFTGAFSQSIKAGDVVDFAIVVFADDTYNTEDPINWGNDWGSINVEVTNTTIIGA